MTSRPTRKPLIGQTREFTLGGIERPCSSEGASPQSDRLARQSVHRARSADDTAPRPSACRSCAGAGPCLSLCSFGGQGCVIGLRCDCDVAIPHKAAGAVCGISDSRTATRRGQQATPSGRSWLRSWPGPRQKSLLRMTDSSADDPGSRAAFLQLPSWLWGGDLQGFAAAAGWIIDQSVDGSRWRVRLVERVQMTPKRLRTTTLATKINAHDPVAYRRLRRLAPNAHLDPIPLS